MLKVRTLLGHLSGHLMKSSSASNVRNLMNFQHLMGLARSCSTKNHLQMGDIPATFDFWANIAVTKWGATAWAEFRIHRIIRSRDSHQNSSLSVNLSLWGHRKWRKSPVSIIWCPKKQTLASLTMEIAPPCLNVWFPAPRGVTSPVEACWELPWRCFRQPQVARPRLFFPPVQTCQFGYPKSSLDVYPPGNHRFWHIPM